MLSNEAEDHSDQETEAEYIQSGVINLSGQCHLHVRGILSKMSHESTCEAKLLMAIFCSCINYLNVVFKIVWDVPGILETCVKLGAQ